MNKKFVNLPQKYKIVLNNSKKLLNKDILEKLLTNSITFNEIDQLYKNINTICKSNDCNSYDINKMIHNYGKKNSMIDILKKIANLRNKYLVTNAYRLPIWKQNIRNLKKRCQKITKKKVNNDIIEKSFLKLLKNKKYNWDGLWSVIETNKRGDIQNINVFDLEDFETLMDYINN